jgi:ornithine carbamoyltransferase
MTTSAAVPAVLTGDLLTGSEWSAARLRDLFTLTTDLKANPDKYRTALAGRFIALIMEKASLRTRVTFEVGMGSLGGQTVFLDQTLSPLGKRETIPDVARNLSRWVQGIVARVHEQRKLELLAQHASIPVINALSDRYHPCQALADFFTIEEHFGSARGLKLAYVGDGNNVCHSLLIAGARLGADMRVATPAGYEPKAEIVAEAKRAARDTGAKIELMRKPEDAVTGAKAVYTDVWASMGQEHEEAKRKEAFAAYQVNDRLMMKAAKDAVFMHCLPAHRGAEVTDAVMDSRRSVVFDQAENRMHVQKAILLTLMS